MPPRSRTFFFGLAAVAVFAGALFAACGDDDDDSTPNPTTPPTTATPSEPTKAPPTTEPTKAPATPAAEVNTPAGFKAAMATLNKDLGNGSLEPLIARFKSVEYTCTAADLTPGLGQPECKTAGEKINGFQSSAWRSEGGLRKVESVIATLKDRQANFDTTKSDKYGAGTLRVYAFDSSKNVALITVTSKCLPEYNCSGFQRLNWVANFEFSNGKWQVTSLMTAFVLGEDFLDPSAEGKLRMPAWEKLQ